MIQLLVRLRIQLRQYKIMKDNNDMEMQLEFKENILNITRQMKNILNTLEVKDVQ